jgi:hypothetical protein
MRACFLVASLGLLTLASGAYAQTTGSLADPSAPPKPWLSPLQQNLGSATAAPRSGDRSKDLTQRCKEIAASYNEAFRPAGVEQANAVVPNYGRSGEQKNTMQAYNQRRDAEKEFHDLGCR